MKSELLKEWEAVQERIVTCRKCPRLVAWREEVARTKRRAFREEEYWGKPVRGFGDREGRVLIVGLAPAAHGANRTGRPFTGDQSGNFLYSALYRAGFASQPVSTYEGDGLALRDLYIAAVCRCAPPGNLPTREEIANCLPFLGAEISLMENLRVIVALGHIAFENTLRLMGRQAPGLLNSDRPKFAHGVVVGLGDGLPWLVASYHPSQQNTQTGRLTREMFAGIWDKVRELIS